MGESKDTVKTWSEASVLLSVKQRTRKISRHYGEKWGGNQERAALPMALCGKGFGNRLINIIMEAVISRKEV